MGSLLIRIFYFPKCLEEWEFHFFLVIKFLCIIFLCVIGTQILISIHHQWAQFPLGATWPLFSPPPSVNRQRLTEIPWVGSRWFFGLVGPGVTERFLLEHRDVVNMNYGITELERWNGLAYSIWNNITLRELHPGHKEREVHEIHRGFFRCIQTARKVRLCQGTCLWVIRSAGRIWFKCLSSILTFFEEYLKQFFNDHYYIIWALSGLLFDQLTYIHRSTNTWWNEKV